MKELVNTYSKYFYSKNFSEPGTHASPMDRDLFYEGICEGKFEDLLIEVVQIFLFKPNGQVALQKRSTTKKHNPGLLDKSIGGHITSGQTPKLTVMAETIQELGAAAYVSNDADEFGKMMEMLGKHIDTVSLALRVDTVDTFTKKLIDGQKFMVGNRSHVYFAVYDGALRFKDSEAAGINYFSLEELKEKMKNDPSAFTDDMHFYLDAYWNRMLDFRKRWLQV
ncbi:NUDIX domain-containing protein [Candidatus Nomurabacteria bacterium]|nr:NUDIX domain-containing protein [Candidatus Nomurabacteria bacterium]